MLQSSEWLSDAEKVPVGQSRRVYHGAEKRPNLIVWNNTDSWSCYCHACHDGGKVYKEVLQPVAVVPPKFQKYLSASDCLTLPELSTKFPDKFKRLVLFLHSKHMSTTLLMPYSPLYNCIDDRLVLGYNGAFIGRDITGVHPAKWFKYHSAVPMDFMYLQGGIKHSTREPVVLTEDLFSAIKVREYTRLSTLWCSGTHISDAILAFLTLPRQGLTLFPVLAFDGDKAGWQATRVADKRLSVRGVPFGKVVIPDGLDPKDLDHRELNELFKEYYNG